MKTLSVILPTFNESGNICILIERIMEVVPKDYSLEILVMDDSSSDGTFELVLKTFSNYSNVRPFLRANDRGLALSIYEGIRRATGELILVMDTDLTHNPDEIPALLHISDYFDVVSASRFCSGGRMSSQAHYISSFAYNLVLRVILGTQVQDNLGGFYVMRKDHLNRLDCDSIFTGYGEYFFRLLYSLRIDNRSIVEIPSCYLNRSRGSSKSNWFKMFFSYGWAAFSFKYLR